ncbi:hypothetical protein FISHEDRAFT_47409, partial [Fistulina hepatica ATCC 64428]
FFFTAIQLGIFDPQNGIVTAVSMEEVDDLATYGIDWEDLADDEILRHHILHNPQGEDVYDNEEEASAAFAHTNRPLHMANVEVPAFDTPFTMQEQVDAFNEEVNAIQERLSRDMEDRRMVWIRGLHVLNTVLSVPM